MRELAHQHAYGIGIGIGIAIENGIPWFDSDPDSDSDRDGDGEGDEVGALLGPAAEPAGLRYFVRRKKGMDHHEEHEEE